MTTETVLEPEQQAAFDAWFEKHRAISWHAIPAAARAGSPIPPGWGLSYRASAMAGWQAALQSPEIETLGVLLRESRQQLPLAAQFWHEDDEPERGSRNVKLVMELIARIDAAMEKHP